MLTALRAHRVAAAAWVVFGSAAMYLTALSIAHEMSDFPGGPDALARSMRTGAEAMRVIRWPADRLDTLGGYLTFHNIMFFNLFLAVYGGVQGARAIRAAEEGSSLEEILATGRSRASVVRDLALGFAATAAVIALGLGLGTAASVAAGDEPDLAGSLITLAASGGCAMVGFALGLLVSQLVGTARAAAGLTSLVLAVLYVGNNVADEIGPLGVVRFASPFHYANESRALVPGLGFDVGGMSALVLMTGTLLALATWAFQRRDYRAPLWVRAPREVTRRAAPVQRRMLRTLWTASLLRGWVGLLAWSLSMAAWALMYGLLLPTVMEAWSAFEDYTRIAGGGPGDSPEAQYLSLIGDLLTPVVAAYVVTQAAGWVADLEQGRVETVLAAPVSWTRLVLERATSTLVGVRVIVAAAFTGLAVGIVRADVGLDVAGLVRVALGSLLLGAATVGVAALAVAWLRRSLAVVLVAVYLGTSYLLGMLVALLEWPAWVGRFSVFGAFGHPYLGWPPASGTVILLALSLGGLAAAAAVAERSRKVA